MQHAKVDLARKVVLLPYVKQFPYDNSLVNKSGKQIVPELTDKRLTGRSANVSNEKRLDISLKGYWAKHQMSFFDERIFDPSFKYYDEKACTAPFHFEWERTV